MKRLDRRICVAPTMGDTEWLAVLARVAAVATCDSDRQRFPYVAASNPGVA